MKKFLFLLPIFLILQIDAFSQVDLGLIVGLDNSKLSGDKFPNTKYKSSIGYIFGITIDPHLNDIISLSFHPGISHAGSRIQVPDTIQNQYKDSITVRVNRIHLPIFVKIQSKSKRVYFLSGVAIGYGLSLKAESDIEEIDISDELKKWNIALNFGFGYQIPIKKSKLYFELRYGQSLINIANPDPDEVYNIPRVKLGGLKILTGFQIPVIKRNKIN